ncbi:MAG: type II secretion system ATPase GspE [Candidatus Riflebacteria bacterium]|nr:type II secretion system ATPase GspE [Candidatus Riflebacteria bacterium]
MAQLIGEILKSRGLISQEDLDEAILVAKQSPGRRVEEVLLENKTISEEDLLSTVASRIGFDWVAQIRPEDLEPEILAGLPIDFLRTRLLLPLKRSNGEVRVAVSDPFDPHPLDDLKSLLKADVVPVLAAARVINQALNAFLESQKDLTQRAIQDLDGEAGTYAIEEFETSENLLDVAQKAPVIKLVNSILFEAMKARASDIHIESYEKHLKVRYRIDGILYDAPSPPKHVQSALISRIKIQSGLNIAESRLPQDGRMNIVAGDRKVDIRVSMLPTAFGERVVMRLLDKSRSVFNLTELGFLEDTLATFAKLLEAPYGIILVTGPTGSGKSTTLYSALTSISTTEKNIITVEDPIENQIKNVSQMQVKPQIGLTFAEGLRSILRQDPDVIMVGEIRDHETAEIAVQASLTGHLVFSTLHTNDSSGAVTRLIDMGVEPYLISSSVIGILAQRLVRVICPECRASQTVPEKLKREYGLTQKHVYVGAGCDNCRKTGFLGRLGIFELLVVTDPIRELITTRTPSGVIKARCVAEGMTTLRQDGFRKVDRGTTTVEEVVRVTQG